MNRLEKNHVKEVKRNRLRRYLRKTTKHYRLKGDERFHKLNTEARLEWKEKAKELVAIIKGLGLKVQAQIAGEKIKVSSAKKDDLQGVITHLRALDFSLPLRKEQFSNQGYAKGTS